MAYDFKKLSEVEAQDKPSENTTVMAFASGQPKQIPASEFGGKGLVVDLRAYTMNTDGSMNVISDISYDPIYEAVTAGRNVVFRVLFSDIDCFCPYISSFVIPGEAMFVDVVTPDATVFLEFTNGSYHATDKASE